MKAIDAKLLLLNGEYRIKKNKVIVNNSGI